MTNRHDRDDRLDRYLYGEMPPHELLDEPLQEEERLRVLLDTLREEINAPRTLRAAVMRQVAEGGAPLWHRLLDWSLRPQCVTMSPARGLALAFAASLVLFLATADMTREGLSSQTNEGMTTVMTRFVFVAPEARSVHVTGDFVAWSREGIALQDLRGTGIWTADVPLPPGVHEYTVIVNGTEWRPDPRAMAQVDDGFGRVNSVVIVSGESAA